MPVLVQGLGSQRFHLLVSFLDYERKIVSARERLFLSKGQI